MERVMYIKEKRKDEIDRFQLEVGRAKYKLDPTDSLEDLKKASLAYFAAEIQPALYDLQRSIDEMKKNEFREFFKPDAGGQYCPRNWVFTTSDEP